MSFRPDVLGGPAGGPAPDGARRAASGGQVNYRLARNAIVSEFRKGRLGRLDVCDAHPELLRAARNLGTTTGERCPICDSADVVLVSYVFGSGLPSGGRCIGTDRELAKLDGRSSELACYVVEVCPGCSWNHLSHTFPLGGRRRAI